jgi:serine kinase of HPr protein (carbohydrate metabolism regulator)
MERIHATSVALNGNAVLLRGASGSGKSDLALRLIDDGWDLVSDDYTELNSVDGILYARAPKNIQGLIEVRGIGIVRLGCVAQACVVAAFNLKPLSEIERLPELAFETWADCAVPCFALHGFDASAPAKVRMTLRAVSENLFHNA